MVLTTTTTIMFTLGRSRMAGERSPGVGFAQWARPTRTNLAWHHHLHQYPIIIIIFIILINFFVSITIIIDIMQS